MYNGLGLRTARGSGTNGYVQRNQSFAKPRKQTPFNRDELPSKVIRKPHTDILIHKGKRQVEVDCLLFEEELKASDKYFAALQYYLYIMIFFITVYSVNQS
jgi:serine/arginine repetitive matrix protein 2